MTEKYKNVCKVVKPVCAEDHYAMQLRENMLHCKRNRRVGEATRQ